MESRKPLRVAPILTRAFGLYNRRFLRRNFHAVRISKSGLPPVTSRPLLIYLNHASWWDPLVCLFLARTLFADRTSHAPMDAEMLERYRIFKRLGFFPVRRSGAAGTRHFLRTAREILSLPRNVLWLTPQGRFADVRERPLGLQNGIGALAARERGVTFVPLAIEYSFWTEPRPEILLLFGEPVTPNEQEPGTIEDLTARFEEALEETQDELAARSCRRDPREWLTLTKGAAGSGSIYDAVRWVKARLRGQQFVRGHQTEITS